LRIGNRSHALHRITFRTGASEPLHQEKSMSYTTLTSYHFERGKGFTEESVLAFRSLAFAAIDELFRSQPSSTATFPLSDDELRLVLNYRAAAAETALPVVSEPMSSYLSQEVSAPVSADQPGVVEAPDTDADLGSPADDDFAAAARWLALATRNQTESYQPSLVRQRG
jgi:hypothetical protein